MSFIGLTNDDKTLLEQINGNSSLIYDRTSPKTEAEQDAILIKYIREAEARGVNLSIRHAFVPIDDIYPIHLELDGEQLNLLEPIYRKRGCPNIILESAGGDLINLDGHHRINILKYRLGENRVQATILELDTPLYNTEIGKTYGELREDDFIID